MSHECIHIDAIRDVIPSALGCEECPTLITRVR